MTPVSPITAKKIDVQPHSREDGSRASEVMADVLRRDPKAAWIRPAPGDDKYTDVPCTD